MKHIVSAVIAIMAILISVTSCAEDIEGLFASSMVITGIESDDYVFECSGTDDVLRIGFSEISGKIHPLFFKNSSDENVVKIFSVSLFIWDNNKISEDSIASYSKHEFDNGRVDYTFSIRDDVMFSDGEVLNVDDIIFTMYILSDPSYDGIFNFANLPILGMVEYQKRVSEKIDGIVRKDDFSFVISLKYDVSDFVTLMSFPIVPLHHYGNVSQYDFDSNEFGFSKGCVEEIKSKDSIMLGAGPYKFDMIDNGILYMSRNDNYYRGKAFISKIEIHDITNIDNAETVNKVQNGVLDLIATDLNNDIVEKLLDINNGEIDGDYLRMFSTDRMNYGYIGICADNVKVGEDKDSVESKNLRKAFSTLFSVYREKAIKDYYGTAAALLNNPIPSPLYSFDFLKSAYSDDIYGNAMYNVEMLEEERYAAALEAAKSYFIGAGFVFDEECQRFVSAPMGAKLRYSVTLNADGIGDHPCYDIFLNAKKTLLELGIVLEINDMGCADNLWDALAKDECQIWAAAWNVTKCDSTLRMFHSSLVDSVNYFGIDDMGLDVLISMDGINSNQKEWIYSNCIDIVFDWAVVVPVYQRNNALIVNSNSLDMNLFEVMNNENGSWIDNIHYLQ